MIIIIIMIIQYIYIYRERERDTICLCVYMHIHIYCNRLPHDRGRRVRLHRIAARERGRRYGYDDI